MYMRSVEIYDKGDAKNPLQMWVDPYKFTPLIYTAIFSEDKLVEKYFDSELAGKIFTYLSTYLVIFFLVIGVFAGRYGNDLSASLLTPLQVHWK